MVVLRIFFLRCFMRSHSLEFGFVTTRRDGQGLSSMGGVDAPEARRSGAFQLGGQLFGDARELSGRAQALGLLTLRGDVTPRACLAAGERVRPRAVAALDRVVDERVAHVLEALEAVGAREIRAQPIPRARALTLDGRAR